MFRNALATLYYNSGKLKTRPRSIRKIIAHNPNLGSATKEFWFLRLGETLRRANDLNGAMTAFNKAADSVPSTPQPSWKSACCWRRKGRRRGAEGV